tara:strand:- start:2143 stop:2358 length:216 start_codon:yes stop_codon:yes gene_type:complete
MTDLQFISMIVYLGLVGGAWYHGWHVGIKIGAGNMYDYLYDRGTKRGKYVHVRLESEPKDGGLIDKSNQDK